MSSGGQRPARRTVPHEATRSQRWGAWALCRFILGVAATCRIRLVDPAGVMARIRSEPVIFALWHNRLAFSLVVQQRMFEHGLGGRRLAALVSASRDGAFLAAVLEAFGVQPVRGSSSRRGARALLEMRDWAARGLHLTITPDGPRGPVYRAQAGVVALARLVGRPIIPVSINVGWRLDVRSWDRFQVPLPFGLCEVALGEPLEVGADGEEALEAGRAELERRMMGLTRD